MKSVLAFIKGNQGFRSGVMVVAIFAALALLIAGFLRLAAAQRADVIHLLGAIAWPAVVAIAVIALRKPVAGFLERLAPRITKLSAFKVDIELKESAGLITELSTAHGLPYKRLFIRSQRTKWALVPLRVTFP